MTAPVRFAGLSGQLVSESFLAAIQSRSSIPIDLDPIRRRLRDAHALARHRLGPASPARALFEALVLPMLEALGFESIDAVRPVGPLLTATAAASGGSLALVVAPWGDVLDPLWRVGVVEAHRRSTSWCVLTNGITLRIVDASRLYSRRFLQADLAAALDDDGTFAAVWMLARAEALCAPADDPASLHALVADSDRHGAGVRRSLRDGVLAASGALLNALLAGGRGARLPLADGFEQAVTIVYRIVFLLFAEARALVPLWHPIYRESYSIASLCDAIEASTHTPGLWDGLRAIARLAHAGCRAGDLNVTAFNGRLFSPARTPLAERRDLDDRAARTAMLALATRIDPSRGARERIVYRDLGVEQLGAVYETLLDYRPVAISASERRDRTGPSVRLEDKSGIRKSTGTFYTPQSVADHVVRRALTPLVAGLGPDAILQLRIVDPAMGSGAFLVSACRFLAASYEQALLASGACHATDIDEGDRVGFRRRVAERCLYGVDINPMAVQLARLSLWLATLSADRPLSFLDHRLLAGDSLIGAWLANLRRPPTARPRTPAALPLFEDDAASTALSAALPLRFSLESAPNDTVEHVRRKERELAALWQPASGLSRWRQVADLWCACWFSDRLQRLPPAAYGALADAMLGDRSALPAHQAAGYLETARAAAADRRWFHWELEFPEVFFEGDGRRRDRPGFDAVIGNPPWEMMRADGGTTAARSRARATMAASLRFARSAGAFTAQSGGHVNCYQLFVERAIDLTRSGGRIGLVVPSGLAADHGSAALRRHLFNRCDVDALVGVDNRRGIFPIHRSVRFLLLTATAGASTRTIGCRFGVEDTNELDIADHDEAAGALSPIQMSPALLERLSGASIAIPYCRAPIDLAIVEKAAALFRPLGDRDGWHVAFGRELNATDDRDAFRSDGRGVPIVDGKHVTPFRVQPDRTRTILTTDARRRLGANRVGHPRLAYRDVASASNRVTLIAAVLPAACVSTHTVFCLRTPLALRHQHLLCGLFNSLVVNYLVRLRVSTHVTTALVEQLHVPTADADPGACREIAAVARRLARHDDPGALATLNARVAQLYQLTRAEFAHVLDTFPLVPRGDRDAALRVFDEVDGEGEIDGGTASTRSNGETEDERRAARRRGPAKPGRWQ